MAKCIICNKSGLFLKVNKAGLCEKCLLTANAEIRFNTDLIHKAEEKIKKRTSVEEVSDGYSVLMEKATLLKEKYESKGIRFKGNPPSLVIDYHKGQYGFYIYDALNREFNNLIIKIFRKLKSTRGRRNNIQKFKEKYKKYKNKVDDPEWIEGIEDSLEEDIKKIENFIRLIDNK